MKVPDMAGAARESGSGLRGGRIAQRGKEPPWASRGRREERAHQGQMTCCPLSKGKERRRTRNRRFLFYTKHSTRQARFANTTCIYAGYDGQESKSTEHKTYKMKHFPGFFQTTGVIYFNNISFLKTTGPSCVSVVYSSGIPSYSEYPSARFIFSSKSGQYRDIHRRLACTYEGIEWQHP